MNNLNERFDLPLIVAAMFVFWTTWHTGLATDDFVHLNHALRTPIAEMLLPTAYLSTPVLQYTHAMAYALFGSHMWMYDILKAVYLLFALFASARFFSVFTSIQRAHLGAIVFILCPLHDGATLWLTGQYLILSLAFYFLAYVSAQSGHTGRAVLLALLASFSSYGSPPLAAGLTLMLLLQRHWRGALALALPNAAYIVYYGISSVLLKAGTTRLPYQFDFYRWLKSYFAQLASFADAALGPSAWLKYTLSIASLGTLSAIVAAAAAVSLWRWARNSEPASLTPQTRLLAYGTLAISLSAFAVFALTGAYPQVAFNLGDRVVIYGVLFLNALLIRYAPTRTLTVAAVITLIAFLGISDHWKAWNDTTQTSSAQIRTQFQTGLASQTTQTIFVSGLQYSRLGPMTHIDHFTAGYVIHEIFSLTNPGRNSLAAVSYNHRLRLQGDSLVDVKYGNRHPVGDSILVYDAGRNTLTNIAKKDIAESLAALPDEPRHWTQMLGPGLVRETILWLMPSLKYAYP
jgi:hypothetical protein